MILEKVRRWFRDKAEIAPVVKRIERRGGVREGAGRKSVTDVPRSASITIKLTPAEKQELLDFAAANGVNPSTAIRNFILRYIVKGKPRK